MENLSGMFRGQREKRQQVAMPRAAQPPDLYAEERARAINAVYDDRARLRAAYEQNTDLVNRLNAETQARIASERREATLDERCRRLERANTIIVTHGDVIVQLIQEMQGALHANDLGAQPIEPHLPDQPPRRAVDMNRFAQELGEVVDGLRGELQVPEPEAFEPEPGAESAADLGDPPGHVHDGGNVR